MFLHEFAVASGTIGVDGSMVRLRSAIPIVVGLPRPKPGTMYVVSLMVALATKRADVLAPFRRRVNAVGKTVAAERLIRLLPVRVMDAGGGD